MNCFTSAFLLCDSFGARHIFSKHWVTPGTDPRLQMQRGGEAATHLRCRRPGFCSLQCLALLLCDLGRGTWHFCGWIPRLWSWRGHNCYSIDVVRINAAKSVKCSGEMVTGAGSRVRLSLCETTMGKIHFCLLEAQ